MQQQYHLRQSWLWLMLLPLLIIMSSCSGTDTDDAGNPPAASTMPISFTALSKWDEAKAQSSDAPHTRLSEDATTKALSFDKDDAIGVFAYLNDSQTPNFMNNQKVIYNGSSWGYSPVKYWPNNDTDQLSFYAYYPQDSNQNYIVINQGSRTPSFTYSNKNLDFDLMASDRIDRTSQSKETVTFALKHLMAKIVFTFTYTSDEEEKEYEPVVHMVEFGKVPYNGVFSYESGTNKSPDWSSIDMDNTITVKRFTKDSNGIVITNGKKTIPDLDTYLFPQSKISGEFKVSINNKLYTYTLPEDKSVTVEKGKVYNLCFNIKRIETGNYFIASYSLWEQGEDIIGDLK